MQGQNIDVAVIGGGPAGLMAAEIARQAGFQCAFLSAWAQPGANF